MIAEIGADISRFPTAGHLVSWTKFAPIDRSSAGMTKTSPTGKGNPWLGGHPRRDRRCGKRRVMVAVGNSVLTIAWNLLSDPDASYLDLEHGYYQARSDSRHRERGEIRRLEPLTGQTVSPPRARSQQPDRFQDLTQALSLRFAAARRVRLFTAQPPTQSRIQLSLDRCSIVDR